MATGIRCKLFRPYYNAPIETVNSDKECLRSMGSGFSCVKAGSVVYEAGTKVDATGKRTSSLAVSDAQPTDSSRLSGGPAGCIGVGPKGPCARPVGDSQTSGRALQPEPSKEEISVSTALPGRPHCIPDAGPPIPACEEQMLAAMASLNIFSMEPTPQVDASLSLLCQIFDTEHAWVILFGDRRARVLAGRGVISAGQVPWSACAWTLAYEQARVIAVDDASKDPR